MAKGASPLQNASCRRPGQDLKTGLRNGKLMIGGMLTEYARPSLAKLYKQAGFDFLYVEYVSIVHIYKTNLLYTSKMSN